MPEYNRFLVRCVVAEESTRAFLQNYMAEFRGFIARVYTVLPRTT
jgi:hypothetical protein